MTLEQADHSAALGQPVPNLVQWLELSKYKTFHLNGDGLVGKVATDS